MPIGSSRKGITTITTILATRITNTTPEVNTSRRSTTRTTIRDMIRVTTRTMISAMAIQISNIKTSIPATTRTTHVMMTHAMMTHAMTSTTMHRRRSQNDPGDRDSLHVSSLQSEISKNCRRTWACWSPFLSISFFCRGSRPAANFNRRSTTRTFFFMCYCQTSSAVCWAFFTCRMAKISNERNYSCSY